MGRPIQEDQTSVTTTIRIIDSTDGTPEQSVEHDTAGIALWYRRGAVGAKTTITPVALAALTTAYTSGGIEHIDDGYYRLDVPNAAFATGVDDVQIGGAVTGMVVLGVNHPITGYDPVEAVNDILTDTAVIGAAGVGLTALATQASVNTVDANVDAILLDTDVIGVAGAGLTALATQASVNTIDTNVDAILVDTGTTIPGTITTVNANVDAILIDTAVIGAAGAGLTALATQASVNTIDTNVDAILVDTAEIGAAGAGLTALATQASVNTIDANVDAILLDTAEIGTAGAGLTVLATQASVNTVDTNVDAILVDTGTTIPATITTAQADLNTITGATGVIIDATEASDLVGEIWNEPQVGYVTAGTFGLYLDAEVSSAATAASVASAVWDKATASHTTPGSFGAHDATVLTNVNAIQTDLDNATDGLGALKALIDTLDGVADSILVDTGTTIPATITTAQNDLDIITGATGVNLLTATQASIDAIEVDTGTTIPGTITTVQADLNIITDTDGIIIGAAAVDLIWDEPTVGHATAGTTGKALTDAGALGDPWLTALPGAYGAGTAGKIVGDNLDAPVQTVLDGIGTVTNLGSGATLGANLDDMAGTTFNAATDSLEEIKDNLVAGSGLTPLASGTCQAPADNTEAKLAASETFADDELNGNVIKITSGTGAGQSRVITDYTGATDLCAVTPNFTTTLDATSVYEIVPGSVNITAVSNGAEDLPAVSDVPTAAATAIATWDLATSGHTTSGTFGEQAKTDIDSILTKVTNLDTTKIPDVISQAVIRTQADNANSAIYLDQILANSYDSASPDGATDSLWNEMTENNAGVTRFTGPALAQATGGVGTIAAIADGVWDELKAGHVVSGSYGEVLQYILTEANLGAAVWDDVRSGHVAAGSFGEALTSAEATRDAAIADAVWDEATVGHVASNTFGEQAGTDIDAILSATGAVIGTSQLYNGTIASLTTQTSMTLTATYPPDADSLNDHMAVFQDASTVSQVDAVRITDYSAAGVITLERAPVWTIIPTDKIVVLTVTPGASGTRLDLSNATSLTDIGLDHMFAAGVIGTDVTDGSFAAKLVSDSATADFDDFDHTLHSLKQISETTQSAAILSTTIVGLAGQSNITLADGPTEALALVGCLAVITNAATSTQLSIREITGYAVTTKVMTLDSAPTFTVATTDIVDIYPARTLVTDATIRTEMDSNSTELATLVGDTTAILAQQSLDTAVQVVIQTETDKIAAQITADTARDVEIGLVKTETDKIPATIVTIDAISTAVDNLAGLEILDSTVSTVDSPTSFRLTAGLSDNSAALNGLAVFTDAVTATQKSFRVVSAYVASGNIITVDSAPDFIIGVGDRVQVFAVSTLTDATLLSDLAAVKVETDKIPAVITTQGSQTSTLGTVNTSTGAIAGNQTALLARHATNDSTAALIKAKTDLIAASGGDDTAVLAAISGAEAKIDTINSTTTAHTTNINRIDEIETKIDTIDSLVDLIKVETDKVPATITKIDSIKTTVEGMDTNGVSLTTAYQSTLIAGISGTAIGGNNITVSIENYGQLVAGTLTLKEGQEEQVTFTSTVADTVPDLGADTPQLLFGYKTADKSYALRCLTGAFLVNTGLQSIRVDISETLAKNLIPGRGEFDLWVLYGYVAATGAYTDARLFANGPCKVDSTNVQFTI